MKTITITVYTFDELSDKAKEKARDWFRNGNTFDSEPTIEDAKQCFALVGWDIATVYYSGFSSQGDGACFQGTWRAADVKPGKLKEHAPLDAELHRIAGELERIAAAFPHAYATVKHSGHYQHEHCTDFAVSIVDGNGEEIESPAAIQAEKDLIEASRDAMRWIYARLESAYDWENADEQVDESLRCNGNTFTAEGKRFG